MLKIRSTTFTALISVTALNACAGLNTRLPDIAAPDLAAETQFQETQALNKIDANGAKYLNVGWPILKANAELCPKIRNSIGIRTHTLKAYSKRLRTSAGRVLGADETPRIFHVVKGSPADKAGLKRGDVILGNDGEPAKFGSESWKEDLANKQIKIRRGTEEMSVNITPEMVCDYNLVLSNSSAINAFADGRNITMTTGMMDFVETDDELALIIGHELAHNTMGHIRKAITNYVITLGGTRYTRPFESEADYVGLYYLTRAGYSPDNVDNFWRRLGTVSHKSINRAKTHPTSPDRYLRIKAAREEIRAKQDAGVSLFPNFIAGSGSSGS